MREWQIRQQLPPVLLLTGQAGIGKRTLTYHLARWILCESEGFHHDALQACGKCPSCQRILAGNEVNLTEITAETEGESDSQSGPLKIERYRLILIPSADRMTVQAANSVLKLLEETPRGWIFLLTAHDPTLLLPTIVSRCQTIRLKPFLPDALESLLELEGVDPKKRKICAQVAQGSWSRALAFADEEVWKQRDLVFEFLEEPSAMIPGLVDWASQKPNHLELLIDLLEQLTGDLIRWSTSQAQRNPEDYSWMHIDGRSSILSHIRKTLNRFGSLDSAREFWFEQAHRLAQSRQESLTPVNKKLLIQDLLIPWLGGQR
jgi:DNA polymerase-3 subunit delta'